jgi:hypothetical protein
VAALEILPHFDALRNVLLRMHVIKRTDFIPSGYSLMELLVWITMGLTVMADFDNQLTAYFTTAFTALQFFYVIALLRDIDRLLMEETGLPVICAEDPLTCVVRGSGLALEQMDRVSSIFTSD